MSEECILHGPDPLIPLPKDPLGIQWYKSLLQNKHLPVALIDAITNETVSYATILEKTCRLAESLKKYGLSQNSVIGICSENNLHFFYPLIAAIYLGITVTTFNPSYTPREILHCVNISKPSIIFCSKATLAVVLESKKQIKCVQKIVVIDAQRKFNDIESLDDIICSNSNKHFDFAIFKPIDVNPAEQVALIVYSSGTTGLPKGVMLTHRNITVRHTNSRDARFYKQTKPGIGCALGLLPFYHSYGLFTAYFSLLSGRRLVVLRQFDENLFLKTIQDYKITILHLVPPLAVILAKSPLVDKYDLSSIEEISCGAAPMSRETQEIVKNRLNLKLFRQAYGLTETTLGIITLPYGVERPGSCGKILPYASAKVVDPETGKILSARQNGELFFKGGQVMKGYAANVEATKQVLDKDGWLSTGDLGYYDEDGFFYVVDRLKELIKYKGFQVPPAELEAILLSHPKIQDAGVVGLPHEAAGELPLAFVVKQPNQDLNEEDVENFVAKQVSPQKRLRGGVKFISEIPKNPSGKILRRRLRELVQMQRSKL